jgi:hypothetical protein
MLYIFGSGRISLNQTYIDGPKPCPWFISAVFCPSAKPPNEGTLEWDDSEPNDGVEDELL